MSLILKLTVAALCGYALLVFATYLGQRRLMYFPDPQRTAPSGEGLAGVEERVLTTPDGERIIVWYGKARPGQPTLLYFHGNAGNLAERADRIRRFMGQGWGVYMMSYRGYGGSSGSPTEAANVADARLAYGALVLEGVEPGSIIAYGESLGTGVATRIAAEREVAGLVLESPFTSAADVGAMVYPYLPVRLLIADRYDLAKYIPQIRVPLLILHGERDDVIPVSMGREIARIANEPKRLVTFRNGGHSDLYVDGNAALDALRDWVRRLER